METEQRAVKHSVQLRNSNQLGANSSGRFSAPKKRTSGIAKKLIIAAASFWLPLVGVASTVSTSTPKALEEASTASALQAQLKQMKSAYAFYSSIAQQGGWKALNEDLLLKNGALRKAAADETPIYSEEQVQAITALVSRLGREYPSINTNCTHALTAVNSAPCVFNKDVENAVKDFQRRHGLLVDGVVGRKTLAALNVTAKKKAQQLALNITRLEMFEEKDSDAYVLVNIPEFRLRYISNGKVKATKDVVVGKPSWATPSFSDHIEKFVVNPEWRIPISIATKEIAPKVADNPNYLEENNIVIRKDSFVDDELVDPNTIDWENMKPYQFDHFLVKLPNEKNPLGKVKYLFPNRHAVYVHDTPYQQWFKETNRAASHGCIRLEDPFSLAQLIAEEQGVDSLMDNVISARELSQSKTFHLEEPLPIHLVYWTAWADENGKANFRNDIYQRDRRDAEALTQVASL
ncbi:murein L,D-transpeptidase [Alteromonas mediterranea]|uniref:L,D-transpeptidase family protein n=1 Tax=Alteromonas mediterranea TaxID=314275 RepID=UPI0009033C85|nr:L,D-transpeptidase family protein [Alteromonas mediterranea]APD94553.1 murein L,D-transpeptidase [Alteromonas mediterranea]APD98189.1 murein L,D-transpeptidase [Alteromonas mediterranea]